MHRLSIGERVYLDANATTPPLPKVLLAVQETAKYHWGNPGGSYQEGVDAKTKLAWARKTFAELMNVATPEEILFTSGGTESNNIALRSVMCRAMKEGRNVLITSSVEHPSVKRTASSIGCQHVQIHVNTQGYIDIEELQEALRTFASKVGMVSIILAQNEVGVLQPIKRISLLVKSICPRAIVHTDATQILGKDYLEPERLGVDMMTGSAHKFHGPRGVGILYCKKGIIDSYVTPITGGGQEMGCRSGTENLPGVVGAAVALREAIGNAAEWKEKFIETRANRDSILAHLIKHIPGLYVNGDPARGLVNTLSVSLPLVHGHALAEYLDKHGIAVGSGSACSKGKPSESLQAMYGTSKEATTLIHNTIRISLTTYTSRADCDYAASQIVDGWKSLSGTLLSQ